MNSSHLNNLTPGSAEFVVAHARLRRSRGRRPSMSYLGQRNPREALALAERTIEQHQHYQAVEDLMEHIPPMTPDQAVGLDHQSHELLIRNIVANATSVDEVHRRLRMELGITGASIYWSMPTDVTGVQARDLGRALGGLVSKSGAMVMIMCYSPFDDELINM